MLRDAPAYIGPVRANDRLRIAAAWQRAPLEMFAVGPGTVEIPLELKNPLDTPLRVSEGQGAITELKPGASDTLIYRRPIWRRVKSHPAVLILDADGEFVQCTQIAATNPLGMMLLPTTQNVIRVKVENFGVAAFHGSLRTAFSNQKAPVLTVEPGTARVAELVAAKEPAIGTTVELLDDAGTVVDWRRIGRQVRLPLKPELYTLIPGGDSNIGSKQGLAIVEAPDGLPVPHEKCFKIDYDFEAGWKFLCLSPKDQAIDGKPASLGLWVKGDGSRNIPRMRFVDSTGQTFQPDGQKLDYTDWRYIVFPLDATGGGRWGGANDGVVHYPIRLETMFLIDSAVRQKTSGTVYVASPTLVYSE
jgi:hypothetical protein